MSRRCGDPAGGGLGSRCARRARKGTRHIYELGALQIDDLVLIGPEHQAELPREVGSRDGPNVQRRLEAVVGDRCCILRLRGEPARWRDRRQEDHVGRLGIVVR